MKSVNEMINDIECSLRYMYRLSIDVYGGPINDTVKFDIDQTYNTIRIKTIKNINIDLTIIYINKALIDTRLSQNEKNNLINRIKTTINNIIYVKYDFEQSDYLPYKYQTSLKL